MLPEILSHYPQEWLEQQLGLRENQINSLNLHLLPQQLETLIEEHERLTSALEERIFASSHDPYGPLGNPQLAPGSTFNTSSPEQSDMNGDDIPSMHQSPLHNRPGHVQQRSNSGYAASARLHSATQPYNGASDGYLPQASSGNRALAPVWQPTSAWHALGSAQAGASSDSLPRKRGPSSPSHATTDRKNKFLRPTPSPIASRPDTPSSHNSVTTFGSNIPEDVLAAFGDTIDYTEFREMRRIQMMMEEQRRREADDAEFARVLQEELNESPPRSTPNGNSGMAHNNGQYQMYFDPSGSLQRNQPLYGSGTAPEDGPSNSSCLTTQPVSSEDIQRANRPLLPPLNLQGNGYDTVPNDVPQSWPASNNLGPQVALEATPSSASSSDLEEIDASSFVPNDRSKRLGRIDDSRQLVGNAVTQPGHLGWDVSAPGLSPIAHRPRPYDFPNPTAYDTHGAPGSSPYQPPSNDFLDFNGLNRMYEAMYNARNALTSGIIARQPNWLRSQEDEVEQTVQGDVYPWSRPANPPSPYGNAAHARYPNYYDSVDPKETEEDIKNLVNNIRPDEELDDGMVQNPPDLAPDCDLYPHQKLGLAWMTNMETGSNKGGILADAMGLGKTVQAIALMVSRRSETPQEKTTLIVAPVALLKQWEGEISSKVKPERRLSTYICHGSRKAISWNELKKYDVVLTTYGILGSEYSRKERIELKKGINPDWRPKDASDQLLFLDDNTKFYRVILDEAQNIRNKDTKGFKAVRCLQSQTRFCMTGTPMMNSINELYALIAFLRIRPYCDHKQFVQQISKPLKSQAQSFTESAMNKLHALLKAILLRRTKTSEINGKPILSLPERTTVVDHAVLEGDQLDFYTALENKTQLRFNRYLKQGTTGRFYGAMLLLLLRLRQACCHPHLIRNFELEASYLDKTSEDLERIATHMLSADVIRRVIEEGVVDCPICMDVMENSLIFTPCGHRTCSECFARISDPTNTGLDDSTENRQCFKCMSCRGQVDPTKVTDWKSFSKVHVKEEEADNLLEDITGPGEESTESESETESETDSETDDDTHSLDDFIVPDDEVDESGRTKRPKTGDIVKMATGSTDFGDARLSKSTVDEAKVKVKVEVQPDDDDEPVRPGPSKGKKKVKFEHDEDDKEGSEYEDESKRDRKRPMKKKKKGKSLGKPKGKGKAAKGKNPVKDKSKHKSLSELQKEGKRNLKARHKYFRKLSEGWVTSAKIDKCLEILDTITSASPDEKTIVFSQFTTFLDLLEVAIMGKTYKHTRYDGSMSAVARNDAVIEFSNRRSCRVMLVSLKAGNSGLNLTAANHVIILDPFWNPYVEEQAIDRAHRIGQRRPVFVHRILIQGTVEDRIVSIQERKRELIEGALDEGAQQSVARLGLRDLAYLFGVTS